jgi:hypothetical protein
MGALKKPIIHDCAGRDLRCMLDMMVATGVPYASPWKLCLNRPKTIVLRPNLYHDKGLTPWNKRKFSVISQSVY